MATKGKKRKQWSQESMTAAVDAVNKEHSSLRAASRLYNVPIETLRRRVSGQVDIECRPGPQTVLNKDEESRLEEYCIEMADRGFGLSREDVMRFAYQIAEKMEKPHPFQNNTAGRGWYEGFLSRHPRLSLRSSQPLSRCRAMCSNKDIIADFFAKLGALCGRLNLFTKPMQIYNVDETGVNIVHTPGKVLTELSRKHVYSLTSAERGRTHTVVTCVNASGSVLPPMLIYPRKKPVPVPYQEGAPAGSVFRTSENGWINGELYLEWLKFFIDHIPPVRPVLVIQDGHASHISIDLIELARRNGIFLLCLPAHTTHILQPLDVSVFKSFKSNFHKACKQYTGKKPGRVVTVEALASLIGEAWSQALTPINIMSGFRKCGIYPLNPGQIDDRQLAPSKVFSESAEGLEKQSNTIQFTEKEETLYQKRFEEGYDVPDPKYEAWVSLNHPTSCTKSSDVSPIANLESLPSSTSRSASDMLSDILPLPVPQQRSSKRKKASINSKAVCITDEEILEGLKTKEKEKAEAEAKKEQRKAEKKKTLREKIKKQKTRKENKKQTTKKTSMEKTSRKASHTTGPGVESL